MTIGASTTAGTAARTGQVLVTGANGFVGRHLVDALREAGVPYRRAVRRLAAGVESMPETIEIGGIGGATEWQPALAGVDTVVHLAARVHVPADDSDDTWRTYYEENVVATEALALAAVAQKVRRFIFVSSLAVHGNDDVPRPIRAEDDPHPLSPYARSKWEAEQVLHRVRRDHGLDVVVLRPPSVYGPGNPGNMLRLLRLVERRIPLPFGAVHNRRSMIYVRNLASALVAAIRIAPAAGKTYLLSDGENLSTPDIIRGLARGLGIAPPLFVDVPPLILRGAATLLGRGRDARSVLGTMIVDDTPIRDELGWTPHISVHDGLLATAAWYRSMRAATIALPAAAASDPR